MCNNKFNILNCLVLASAFCVIILTQPKLVYADDDSDIGDRVNNKYYKEAIKLQQQKKYKEAEMVFTMGLMKDPKSIHLYYFRGKLRQHALNNCTDAISDYSKVISMNPNYNPKAFWRRGLCMYQSGLYTTAINDYSSCIKKMPKYGRVYMLRAQAYGKLGMVDKVRSDVMMVKKYDPKYTKAADELLMKVKSGNYNF